MVSRYRISRASCIGEASSLACRSSSGSIATKGLDIRRSELSGGLDVLQYERGGPDRIRDGCERRSCVSIRRLFSTPKDALARVTADVEFVCEARRIARALDHDGAPVYLYSFEYPLEGVTSGRAFHGLETNFLFGNNFVAPVTGGDSRARAHFGGPGDLRRHEHVLAAVHGNGRSRIRVACRCSGRHTTRPLAPDPLMSVASDRYFVFANRLGVASYLRDSQCNFWEPFFFRSALGVVPAAAR